MTNIAFTAPHHHAAEAGMKILRSGGNAVDAMIAAAATIAVVYPHMNSWGGDGFWLIQKPGQAPIAIDACGTAAAKATPAWYADKNLKEIPARGGAAALTMAGTVAGWDLARQQMPADTHLPLKRLFADAIHFAECGVMATASLQAASDKTFSELNGNSDFAKVYLPTGRPILKGQLVTNPGLATLLDELAEEGLNSFYTGRVAKTIANALDAAGSPITEADLADYSARIVDPLTVKLSKGQLFNLPAPTQGIASLMILALYDRIYQSSWNEAERVHHLVECIKQAFIARNTYLTDPSRLDPVWDDLLSDDYLDTTAAMIKADVALPWPHIAKPGDTVWMGALDSHGTMVSFIQSVYWEFGSGVTIPEYGLVWNNRGMSFSLDENDPNYLQPGMKPFHTLNPAFALLNDGRRLSYGTMGGEGQPQTQAALFSRFIYEQLPLVESITKGRWLLGRTWGDISNNLKLEADLATEVNESLKKRGHETQVMPAKIEMMGHAGGICLSPNGDVEAATDPRSDGAALIEKI